MPGYALTAARGVVDALRVHSFIFKPAVCVRAMLTLAQQGMEAKPADSIGHWKLRVDAFLEAKKLWGSSDLVVELTDLTPYQVQHKLHGWLNAATMQTVLESDQGRSSVCLRVTGGRSQ